MIMQREEPSAPRHVEPAVIENLQPLQRGKIVAVQTPNESQQLIPAKRLQLLYRRLVVPEQVEMALENRGVALRERSRIRRLGAAAFLLQDIATQSGIEQSVVLQTAERERHRKHVHELGRLHGCPHVERRLDAGIVAARGDY